MGYVERLVWGTSIAGSLVKPSSDVERYAAWFRILMGKCNVCSAQSPPVWRQATGNEAPLYHKPSPLSSSEESSHSITWHPSLPFIIWYLFNPRVTLSLFPSVTLYPIAQLN